MRGRFVRIRHGELDHPLPNYAMCPEVLAWHMGPAVRELIPVEVPAPPGAEAPPAAFRARSSQKTARNCRIRATGEIVHGTLVIAGRSESGGLRYLTPREARAFQLEETGDEPFKDLVVLDPDHERASPAPSRPAPRDTFTYLVEIDEEGCMLSDPRNELDEGLLRDHVRSPELIRVELPPSPYPHTEVAAYRGAAADGKEPTCRISGTGEVVRGPLVIAGVDRTGNHRFLSYREARTYDLEIRPGENGPPRLTVRPAPQVRVVQDGPESGRLDE